MYIILFLVYTVTESASPLPGLDPCILVAFRSHFVYINQHFATSRLHGHPVPPETLKGLKPFQHLDHVYCAQLAQAVPDIPSTYFYYGECELLLTFVAAPKPDVLRELRIAMCEDASIAITEHACRTNRMRSEAQPHIKVKTG